MADPANPFTDTASLVPSEKLIYPRLTPDKNFCYGRVEDEGFDNGYRGIFREYFSETGQIISKYFVLSLKKLLIKPYHFP